VGADRLDGLHLEPEPDQPGGHLPAGQPGREVHVIAQPGQRHPHLGPVRWIFGGARDAQTPTGCVVVVADMVQYHLLLRLAGSTSGSPRASTKTHRTGPQTSVPNGRLNRTSPSTMSRMSSAPCRAIRV